ncbi:arginine serine-rich coiled-coil 2 [Lambiella insularis]|nr:arginine serine-rich coiled-coil 2 [Lambiella insularis]
MATIKKEEELEDQKIKSEESSTVQPRAIPTGPRGFMMAPPDAPTAPRGSGRARPVGHAGQRGGHRRGYGPAQPTLPAAGRQQTQTPWQRGGIPTRPQPQRRPEPAFQSLAVQGPVELQVQQPPALLNAPANDGFAIRGLAQGLMSQPQPSDAQRMLVEREQTERERRNVEREQDKEREKTERERQRTERERERERTEREKERGRTERGRMEVELARIETEKARLELEQERLRGYHGRERRSPARGRYESRYRSRSPSHGGRSERDSRYRSRSPSHRGRSERESRQRSHSRSRHTSSAASSYQPQRDRSPSVQSLAEHARAAFTPAGIALGSTRSWRAPSAAPPPVFRPHLVSQYSARAAELDREAAEARAALEVRQRTLREMRGQANQASGASSSTLQLQDALSSSRLSVLPSVENDNPQSQELSLRTQQFDEGAGPDPMSGDERR